MLRDVRQIREAQPTAQSWAFPDPNSRIVSVALLDKVLAILVSLEEARK